MTDQVKVSICVPTYNQGQYLRLAVESALAQNYDNMEVVISDNHSTDDTSDYLAALIDRRARVVRPEKHLAMAENWWFCASQSRGEYINILSSDDCLLPDYAGKLSTVLDTHPSAAFAYCPAQLINECGAVIGVERHIGGSFFRKGSDELKRFIRGAGCVFPTMMIRRDCYERAGGFATWDIVGDWDLELRLLQVGDITYHDEVLVQYRIWTTPERDSRLISQLQEIAQLYETTVAKLLTSHPDLKIVAERARRDYALNLAFGIAKLAGKRQFEEGVRQVLRIHDSAGVRLVLWLHNRGLSGPVAIALRSKLWLRQKVKALLYAT